MYIYAQSLLDPQQNAPKCTTLHNSCSSFACALVEDVIYGEQIRLLVKTKGSGSNCNRCFSGPVIRIMEGIDVDVGWMPCSSHVQVVGPRRDKLLGNPLTFGSLDVSGPQPQVMVVGDPDP